MHSLKGVQNARKRVHQPTVFVSNLCYLIKPLQLFQVVLSAQPLSLNQFLPPHHTFVVLSNFCHFLTPYYLFTFYVIYAPYKWTCCTHHTYNSLSCLFVRTLSAPMHLSNTLGAFGHRAILIWGIDTWPGAFSKNKRYPSCAWLYFFYFSETVLLKNNLWQTLYILIHQ